MPGATPKGLCVTTSSPVQIQAPEYSEPLPNQPAGGAGVCRWGDCWQGGWMWGPHQPAAVEARSLFEAPAAQTVHQGLGALGFLLAV